MRAILILGAATAALFAGSASAAPIAQIKDAAARVIVLPENRQDVKFEFITVNKALPIELRTEGGSATGSADEHGERDADRCAHHSLTHDGLPAGCAGRAIVSVVPRSLPPT